MNTLEFLEFTITSSQPGWLCICSSYPGGDGWRQYWRGWPEDKEDAVDLIEGLKGEGLNVYYSAHLFTEKDSSKEYVIPSRTIFADLDDAQPALIPLHPSLLLKSSDHKHQAYWIMNEWVPPEELEKLSKRLTYAVEYADHTGWPLGKMMRVPNTLNHKYVPSQRVRVTQFNKKAYDAVDFNVFPSLSVTEDRAIIVDESWIKDALKVPVGHRTIHDFFDQYKGKMQEGTEIHLHTEAPDRSTALWRLMAECYRAGMDRKQVFCVAYHSKNNKFRDLRYGGMYQLAKDVMRSEREVLGGPNGIRKRINQTRSAPQPPNEKRQAVADMVRNQMLSHGKFIHARGGTLWYLQDGIGRPIPITKVSTQLNVILDEMFGLNPTEQEHQYTVQALINYVAGMPQRGEISSLSYYLDNVNAMLLHTGTQNVVKITSDAVEVVENGHKDIIFMWSSDQQTQPDVMQEYDHTDTWYDALFGMSMDNLVHDAVTREQAMALLRAWFMCLLLRQVMYARPILAIFGQPGSGKSTMFKRLYALLYGPTRAIQGIGTAQEFDYAMSVDAFLALDNVDTWERWMPDRFARAAGRSELTRRKLYTDVDTVTLQLQAFLGITAHNPKFGREDVLDRFIMLTLERIQDFKDEAQIMQNVLAKRDKYWGQIAHDVQRVLAEPEPRQVAQFRVQDFSKVGQRVANALGFGDDFYSAIRTMVDQQKGFVLEEDAVLVELLSQYIASRFYKPDEWVTPAKLWGIMESLSVQDKTFARQYGNSVKLGRKLWAMMDALKQRFTIAHKYDTVKRTRVWKFSKKVESTDGSEPD